MEDEPARFQEVGTPGTPTVPFSAVRFRIYEYLTWDIRESSLILGRLFSLRYITPVGPDCLEYISWGSVPGQEKDSFSYRRSYQHARRIGFSGIAYFESYHDTVFGSQASGQHFDPVTGLSMAGWNLVGELS